MSLQVDIHKQLGDFELHASFETDGGVTGLLGASGCGKSMTLKCIAGIEKPDRGRIVLDGVTLFDSERRVNLPPQARRVGYLFQNYALFPNMSVRANILCGLRGERDRHQRERALEAMIDMLALRGLENIAVMEAGRLLALKDTKALFADPGTTSAARLTGCKNIVRARKEGAYEVCVPDWGVRLKTAQPVGEGLTAVGIRAHYFNAKTGINRYPVRYVSEMEEPFEWIVQFRFEGQSDDAPALWWRVPKDRRPAEFPQAFGVAPANILLLYDGDFPAQGRPGGETE